MPGYSDITTLVCPGGTVTFNAASGNTYWIDPARCTGLIGTGEIRNPVDDKGQTSGFILHTFFEKGGRGVLAGVILADTVANRNSMQDSLKAALRSTLPFGVTGTLNFTSGSLAVKLELACEFPAWSGDTKLFQFGLVSAAAL
jgi:hypothetical protein